ncbi:serine protease persephone-like [Anopheles darlingi]|uniref:serine protease persephone-like n=1 Tax=Anopheles darlingi TaxID=43151 RepID=UPI0021005335|nr:serine protease persephone-like [Anopheles darlingi]
MTLADGSPQPPVTIGWSKKQLFENDTCTLRSGRLGICRRGADCGWARTGLRDRTLTHAELSICGFDGTEPIICCFPGESLLQRGMQSAVQACDGYDGVQSELSFHIVGGEDAYRGEVPFIAALGYREPTSRAEDTPEDADGGPVMDGTGPSYLWACGSTLIAPSFVLTAAHCIETDHGRPVVVRMGTTNLLNPPNPAAVQHRTVKEHHVHPAYRRRYAYHDIGLIEVSTGFIFDEDVRPACIHPAATDLATTIQLLAAGWGDDGQRSRSPDRLLRTNLSTVPLDECRVRLRTVRVLPSSHLPDGLLDQQYCAVGHQLASGSGGEGAGGYHSDTCSGDSGGPLYYIGEQPSQKYVLAGITSVGTGCGSGTPAIYTRPYHYLDWIATIVWPTDANTD